MKRFKVFLFFAIISITGIYAQSYDDVIAKFNEGADEINKGQYTTAIDHFQEVLSMAEAVGDSADELVAKAEEQIPLLNYQVAIAYMKQKDYENAIPYLENTVDLAEEYNTNEEYKQKAMKYLPTLLTGVGTQKMKAGDMDEALRHFESAVNYSPEYPKAYLGLGLVHKALFEEAEMVEALSKAIELARTKNDAKTLEDAQNALGGYFVDQGNMELEDVDPEMEDFSYAIDAFEKAVEYDPDNSNAHLKLAMIYNRMIEYDQAIEHGKKALETETDEMKIAAINYELGNAYTGTAQYDKACEAYNNAMIDAFEERAAAKKEKVPGCN